MKTVSLELAKQLKANGFPQEFKIGSWAYAHHKDDGRLVLIVEKWTGTTEMLDVVYPEAIDKNSDAQPQHWYAVAPTAEEILEQLKGQRLQIDIHTNGKIRITWVKMGTEFTTKTEIFSGENITEILANIWLYLKEQGLL